ncbi:unnamed protein product [Amoebophrya sp. A120]|nr:unnamed protein product [Amoebophrya sp. A120]|eukprot:GSA120T00015030001.1
MRLRVGRGASTLPCPRLSLFFWGDMDTTRRAGRLALCVYSDIARPYNTRATIERETKRPARRCPERCRLR